MYLLFNLEFTKAIREKKKTFLEAFKFMYRIMVGLPSVDNREMILKTLLTKEKVEELDFKELAVMTEGYSGSDLKVCSFYIKFKMFINREGVLALTTETEFVCNSSLSARERVNAARETKRYCKLFLRVITIFWFNVQTEI